jgi:hypothetical protein
MKNIYGEVVNTQVLQHANNENWNDYVLGTQLFKGPKTDVFAAVNTEGHVIVVKHHKSKS